MGETANSNNEISIQRSWYDVEKFNDVYSRHPVPRTTTIEKLKNKCYCSKKRAWLFCTSFLPIIKFIRNYRRKNIIGDFLSGLTATFLHLPQGLGFGILAGLQPVYGLYSTFFPVMIYCFLGTSPYVSFGSNAVMALLTQTVVQREADIFLSTSGSNEVMNITGITHNTTTAGNNSNNGMTNLEDDILQVKVGAAMTASFLTGLILAGMGVLRLGFLTRFMSASFIGGFTTAAAVHIASSQVPKMLGIKVSSHSGAGRLVKMYIELFSNIEDTVISELIISIIAMLILLGVKILINERYKDRMKIPIPIDFIVVVVTTIISYFAKFEDNFDVKIVGDIPSGFPAPKLPSLESASRMIAECVVIAILSLAMTISLAKLTAKEHGIQIDDNQELIAYGLANFGSSFFSCFPQATAPPRTMILSNLGAKTTLNAIPTGVIILLIILWIGTLFQSLPVSVLAAMIIVAMKNLLMQFSALPRLWTVNKFDSVTWVIACFVSIFVDLDYGIMAGIGFSILSIVIQHQLASGRIIGMSDQEDIYLDSKDRANVIEMTSVKIFQFQAPLHFANAEIFKRLLYSKAANPLKIKKMRQKQQLVKTKEQDEESKNEIMVSDYPGNNVKHVILDCQMISHLDLSGINILLQILKEFREVDIRLYIVKCSEKIMQNLEAAHFFVRFPKEHVLFDTPDAMHYINNMSGLDTSNPRELTILTTKI